MGDDNDPNMGTAKQNEGAEDPDLSKERDEGAENKDKPPKKSQSKSAKPGGGIAHAKETEFD